MDLRAARYTGRHPPSSRLDAVRRAYDAVERVLWACGAVALAMALAGLVHAGPRAGAQARAVADDIAAEDRTFCERRSLHPGTAAYVLCLMDLADMRRRHEQRLAEMTDFP